MFNRVVTITGAQHLDEGIAYVRETVDTTLSQQKGFRGITVSVDRTSGVFGVLTIWETEADRDASEGTSAKMREQGLEVIGGTIAVELFEETVVEVKSPPVAGAPLTVLRMSMDPAKVDANSDFFKSNVLPQIAALPGFCAARHMINRTSGKGLVGTVWMNEEARTAAAADAQSRRDEAAGHGVTFDDINFREIAFADIR